MSITEKNTSEPSEASKTYKKLMEKVAEASNPLLKTNDQRSNGNINAFTPMGKMLLYGTEVGKMYALKNLVSPKFAKAHQEGDIHIHDLDFYPTKTTTCVQIPLGEMLENGIWNEHGFIRSPKSISTASQVAAVIIQSSQNQYHGGQSFPNFDFDMAPYVKLSFEKNKQKLVKLYDKFHKGYPLTEKAEKALEDEAWKQTEEDTLQAMEGLVHNLNTMHSRCGSQIVFSSINFGLDTSKEGRLISKSLMQAQLNGLGKHETPIFPILIVKVKDGINGQPGDPNYDIFKMSIDVTAKRLFPNWVFVDAPYNLAGFDDSTPESIAETSVSTMGAITGEDLIIIKYQGEVKTLPFKEAWELYHDKQGVSIYDRGQFVGIKTWIKNENAGDWFDVKFSNGRFLRMTSDHPLPTQRGRVECENLQIGDQVPLSNVCIRGDKTPKFNPWLIGVMLCDSNRECVVSVAEDERDIAERLIELCGGRIKEQHRGVKGDYLDVVLPHGEESVLGVKFIKNLFGAERKAERRLPEDFLEWSESAREQLLAGIIDADGYINIAGRCEVQIGSTNKQLALGELLLVESLGFAGKLYKTTYGRGDAPRYQVAFRLTRGLPVVCEKKRMRMWPEPQTERSELVTTTSIDFVGEAGGERYDVETESGRFDVSGLNSWNCRTRLYQDVNGDHSTSVKRGNASFTSINLPRLAIKANHDIDKFFNLLDDMLNLVHDQLYERYKWQCTACPEEFAYIYKNKEMMGGDKWIETGNTEEYIKHDSLSIGFIGLAETLTSLIGKHHGESKTAQELGLKIIGYMREFCDKKTQEEHLNWSVLGTPAEGLSNRFTKMDQERYGIIPGVTDKGHYTNSSHVPVEYKISAFEKIDIEAPYHALENAGHIAYIELDGDPTHNPEAIEQIVNHMKEQGVGYGAINHPVTTCRDCGFSMGTIFDICPECGSKSIDNIARITGYLVGTVDRWNDGKQDELKHRISHDKGTYQYKDLIK